ncbi:Homeodomain-like domain-containing protein [Nitrosomonas aestuarii]|uniref:Homeodomain-like domain-containing protein n=1 Tax=Nitrosomonas aestuarii TaxID=52441 RepID=A0A1I3X0N7_9PROT|nr:IS630 family transposase [Nitrosomonas aestuarii]SFK13298.1 Homeodomain-like domain-containing protein [Nitrosomonas aestuarii]
MPRKAIEITLTKEQREQLDTIVRSHSVERRIAERAGIILSCAAGKRNQSVALEHETSALRVSKWRKRYAKYGLAGLEDERRPGKPETYGVAFRNRLLSKLETDPPDGMSRWDCPTLAEQLKASNHAVWRALKKEGIYLHKARSWYTSTDPEFAEKSANIIGLYLNPPFNALVLSVGEKNSAQVSTRESGYIETGDQKLVHAYKRHGTLNLIDALNAATGFIKGQTSKTKKREDFQNFMDNVIQDLSENKNVHVILDNYCTYKKNDEWLNRYAGRVYCHFAHTSASWFNQIEVWFEILSCKVLKGAGFSNVAELKNAIEAFIIRHNQSAQPFKWRKPESADSEIKNNISNL